MATARQKEAARRNLVKAREAQRARARGQGVPAGTTGLSSAEENRMDRDEFAFPDERKEPLTDASHVRNAIARFDQVEGVSDQSATRPGSASSPPPSDMTSKCRPLTGGTCSLAAGPASARARR